MSYVKQAWRDGPSGGTPVSAARLGHIEDGIAGTDGQLSRTVHAAGFGIYFPEAEGAVADGGTDDQGAIVDALNAASGAGGRAQVQMAAGKEYAVASSVTVPSDVRLVGVGATLKWIGSGDRPLYLSSVANVEISDLTVDCGATPPGSAVFASGSDRLKFDRVKVTSQATTGAGFRLSGCTNSLIEHCDVQGGGTAYNVTGASQYCTISHSTATGVIAGVLINPSGSSAPSDIDVAHVTVSGFPAGVVLGYPIRSAGTSTARNTRIRFDHCTVIGPAAGYSADVTGATQGGTADQINAVYTDGYTATECISMYGGDMGMSFSDCTKVTLTGNLSAYNCTGGITCSGGSSSVTIGVNTAMNNGQNFAGTTADTARFGINATNATDATIAGNIVGDDQATPTQNYGISTQLGGDNITIGVNTYKGNILAKYYTDGAPTNVTNMDTGAGSDVLGKRASYDSVAASAVATIAAATAWTPFDAATPAPSITLPNDGGTYRIDLHGSSATLNPTGQLNLGFSADGGASMFKTSQHAHTTTGVVDRVHLSAGDVVGSGQTITVWAYATVTGTATLTASGNSPLEIWATRIL